VGQELLLCGPGITYRNHLKGILVLFISFILSTVNTRPRRVASTAAIAAGAWPWFGDGGTARARRRAVYVVQHGRQVHLCRRHHHLRPPPAAACQVRRWRREWEGWGPGKWRSVKVWTAIGRRGAGIRQGAQCWVSLHCRRRRHTEPSWQESSYSAAHLQDTARRGSDTVGKPLCSCYSSDPYSDLLVRNSSSRMYISL